jgi:arabinofuranan 3-O-arabinosyltransferase
VSGATAPFWLVLGESQNAGWKASVKGVGSLGGSQLVDGFANGWRIDPKGKQSLVVDLEWVPQRKVWDAIALSLFGVVLCCALAIAGFRRARRGVVALAGADIDVDVDAEIDRDPVFAFPWLPAGESPGLRTQVITVIAGAAVAAAVVAPWAGALVAVALAVGFRVPRARAVIALAPPVLIGLVGLYVAGKQIHDAVPPVFEWPTLFSRATGPAWAAVVLFAADALYEMVRRGRRTNDEPGRRRD